MNLEFNNNMNAIFVQKRDGSKEEVSFDKVLRRAKSLSTTLDVNPHFIAQKICNQIYDGVSTTELDILGSEICAGMITTHPDYQILAARIAMSNLEKNTSPSFSETIQILYDNKDIKDNNCPLISQELYDIVQNHKTKLNSVIKQKRDGNIGYFGLKTLERSYLFKVKGKIVERPQYMFMRVSIGIHGNNIKEVVKTYDAMSEKYFIHATPTLFNSGTKRPQMSSCFLLSMKDDSIEGIYSSLKDCALISKWAGGIGIHAHNIRAKSSMIRGTNGISNGLVPMLRVFNNTARYVDQCVLPETIIYTTKGPMKIQDVTVGETEIYNLKGGVEVIENVLEHPYEGKILNIETIHSLDKLTITPEHPIYALKGQTKGTNYSVIKNRLDKNLIKEDWIEAGKLTADDMVIYPIPTYENDINSISEEDCYTYGVILRDGYMNNKDKNGYISLHKDNKKYIVDRVQTYFDSKFISNRIDTYDNTTRVYWSKDVALPFKYSDVYNNGEKICHYRWLNLPLNKAKMILKGLIDTDGSKGNELVFDSTSYNLIEAVRFICLRMGILTSGYVRDRVGQTHTTGSGGKVINKNISYSLRIPKTRELCTLMEIDYTDGQFFKFLRHNNLLYTRIKSITETDYSGTLYDLQMTKEHNYLLHQGLVHNGGGKRNGSIAIYLEPWHADVEDFLNLRKNHGNEEERARDLFYALWIPDLFMERVQSNGDWTYMCPDECPGLADCYGDEFKELYERYETEGRGKKTVKAQNLWKHILESQIETGTPYILYKDACNKKSNQKNLGTIKSSNLCCEIIEYSNKDETAVCNLASIGLPRYIIEVDGKPEFDYHKLGEMVKQIVKNLNRVIDINYYPIPETKLSNFRHRPIGIGVQGLADVFAMLKISFDSLEATEVNKLIFETIYYHSMETSMEISRKREKSMKKYKEICHKITTMSEEDEGRGEIIVEKELLEKELLPIREELEREKFLGSYSSFEGSPASEGILQFDLWGVEPSDEMKPKWDKLKKDIKKSGLRNSLLVAPMPTASTSQILSNNECFEPYTSNIYIRRTLAGEFIVINDHLVKDLIKIGAWNSDIKDKIILNEGSVQNIAEIPDDIKRIYKTVWEMSQKTLINMAADRGAFICQSQSLNLFIAKPDFGKLSSMHFYSWKKGLKTGIYYLRTKPVAKAQQFTIDPSMKKDAEENIPACRRDDPDCLACGS